MKLRGISIKGFRIKDGKVLRDEKRLSVSQRLQKRAASKKVRVGKR